MDHLKSVHGEPAPQSEPLLGRESEMVENAAGGYVFPVGDWEQLERFLILGTEGGTYYSKQRPFTLENAKAARRCIENDGVRVVKLVTEISTSGRAPKNDTALFVLAMCMAFGDTKTKAHVEHCLPQVARIGTHLLNFTSFVNDMRGWGRALRRTVASWYEEMPLERLAYQVTKYRSRNGWSHRDVLRLSHPVATDSGRNALFEWITQGETDKEDLPVGVRMFNQLQASKSDADVIELLKSFDLTWEMIPSEYRSAAVWEQLLLNIPMTAMLRNLPTLTRQGVLKPLSDSLAHVEKQITDEERLSKARVHPLSLLVALNTYKSGRSARGSSQWQAIPSLVTALEKAFLKSFDFCEPIDKRLYFAVDVSGSMSYGDIAGLPNCSPRAVAVALTKALSIQAERYHAVSFSDGFEYRFRSGRQVEPLDVTKSIPDLMEYTNRLNFTGTDCSLPMLDAMEKDIRADAFIVLTDNETWAGNVHPAEALRQYRKKTGIAAKLIVLAMTSTGYSIADPTDGGMLDIVGCDTATPRLIEDFIKE